MLYNPKNSREIPVDMSGLWILRKFESACASVSLQHKNKETEERIRELIKKIKEC